MTIAPNTNGGWIDTARQLRELGWEGTLPLPPRAKSAPDRGWTGEDGRWPDDAQLDTWAANPRYPPDANLAIRLPRNVAGIDLDAYHLAGVATWERLFEERGELPPTVMTTSRGDGSGIRLYRVRPEAWDTPGQLPASKWGPAIECIRHGHRYAVVAPSIHPEGGAYRWIDDGTGEILPGPPRPEDLPELPDSWYGGWDQPAVGARLELDRPAPAEDRSGSIAEWWTRDAPGSFLGDLEADGWTVSHKQGDDIYLARPGKDVRAGHSAVLGPSGVLRVFTADQSVAALAAMGHRTDALTAAVTRFHYLAATRHDGDMSAAARHARQMRDGAPPDPAGIVAGFDRPGAGAGAPDDDKPRRRFTLLRGAQIHDIPQPTPLIDGYLDHASLSLVYGKYGSGKTFVQLDWAFHIAAGRAWNGRAVEQGPVCIIAAEGSTGMGARFDAWCQHHHVNPADMGDLYWLPEAAQMSKAADGDELHAVLAEIAPRLVAIDTVARTAVGIEENNATEIGEWIHGVDTLGRRLAADTGIHPCMLGVHHAGKDADRGARGNTALPAATAALFRVSGDATFAELVCERQKDRAQSPRATFRLEPVGSSVVPVWHDLSGERRGPDRDLTAANVLRQLHMISEPGRGASSSAWLDAVTSAGIVNRSSHHEHVRRLVEAGHAERTGETRSAPFAVTDAGREWLLEITGGR